MLYKNNLKRKNHLKVLLAIFSLLFALLAEKTFAAPFKPKDKKTTSDQVRSVNVSYEIKKKTVSKAAFCLGQVPGRTIKVKKNLMFRTLKDDIKVVSNDLKVQARNAKKAASLKKKLADLKAFSKAAAAACASSSGNNPSNPGPNPIPASASLDPYTGTFGTAEARHLLQRFGIGATAEEVDAAVARGLAATVADLLTWKVEPAIDAYNREVECDGRPADDENNETCDPSYTNDLYVPGFRYAWYYGAIKSKNQLFYRTFLFLHDEFMATNSNALTYCDQFAIKGYKDLMWKAVQTGDLKQYMSDFINDQFGSLRYLNLGQSRAPIPNQDFARELWQLGSIGQNRPTTGELNYQELDIISAANILAGWSFQTFRDASNHDACYGAKIPGLSVPGAHTIFYGTPYQAQASNPAELLEATLRHPSASENIANKILLEFLNPAQSPNATIEELAKTLRESGFNLNAALQKLMLSKAFFDPANRNSEFKHPLQLALGFLRQTGIPYDSYNQLESVLTDLGQKPFQSPSVFGWYPDRLSGEAYVLERRNALNWFTTQGDDYYEDHGYSFFDRFLANMPAGQPVTTIAILRAANVLGLTLTANQIAYLDQYMNFRLTSSGCPSQCNGQTTRLVRDVFDPFKGADGTGGNWSRQIRGLILILASMPQYQSN